MNILVATPGRLLQHMNETQYFEASNLQMLVLDEVDRILDLGFKEEVSQVMQNLPVKKIQTLMYSATATKKILDIGKKMLKSDFSFFDVNSFTQGVDTNLTEDNQTALPNKLSHYYMTVPADKKLDTLFGFIKSHETSKCIVFFSSCKQVRFAYEAFSKLKPRVHLMELHGRQKQNKRTAIYFNFVEEKHAFLFCTDIASRGMDFPQVDWVLSVDCPEDTETYIHRVGRTARYKAGGNAL